ncbi:hypothetical protein GCM10009430_00060 [Aquimarina litoralis]|uniref:HTH araC/xylS-type domain-containing protein n=1 Tax=Aquimarina litoralis TaxID=584605 RepID=A0ABN1IEI2_9FLAO
MFKINTLIFTLFALFCCNHILSQNVISDYTQNSDYTELSQDFLINKKDPERAKIIAKNFLNKAKEENDIIKISDGLYMLAEISDKDIAVKYLDSIIKLTVNANDFTYPGKAYLLKATILGSQGRFNESMDELIKVNSLAIASNNVEQQFKTKYYIALLKNELGDFEESRKILETVVSFNKMKFNEDKHYEYDYILSLYAYGNSLNLNDDFDLAYQVNKDAIKLSLKSKDSILYERLLLTSSISEYYREKYDSSLDSINKLLKISNYSNLSTGTKIRIDLHLGKIFNKKKNYDKCIGYLKKSDSLAFKEDYFFPGIRESYELLIDNFKKKGNKDEQLFYINRLLYVDSILDKNYRYLSKQINNEYSKKNLILEKEEIIDSLKKNNKSQFILLTILFVISATLIVLLIYNNKKKKIYKQRFLNLIEENQEEQIPSEKTISDNNDASNSSNSVELGISEIIINDILKNLEKFEEDRDFLKPNITVSSLSKDFNTNSKYLSKVINSYKHKTFSNYVNELRIRYIIEELKKNKRIRQYTIKAIANEIGFNTSEAFSKSFYKTSGIHPSFFLKELKKQNEKSNMPVESN